MGGFFNRFDATKQSIVASDLEVDGTTLVVDEVNNRVGIGVAAPTYTLEVAGTVGFDEYLYHNDDVDTYIRLTDDRMDIFCGGVELIRYLETTSKYVHINPGNEDVNFVVDTDTEDYTFFVDGGTSRVGIGGLPKLGRLAIHGSASLFEQAAADADTAAFGQIWVKDTAPNELWFTTDAGNDIQLTSGTAVAGGGGAAANDLDHILHQQVFS